MQAICLTGVHRILLHTAVHKKTRVFVREEPMVGCDGGCSKSQFEEDMATSHKWGSKCTPPIHTNVSECKSSPR